MSELEATSSGNGRDEDCPLCLEPLPPFWDENRIMKFRCCGQQICMKCRDDRQTFLDNAADSGAWGREEDQLQKCCPFCRSESVDCARKSVEKYEMGQLPLDLYLDLGRCYLNGWMGLEQNVERGVEVFVLGAENGDPNCQYQMGLRYISGEDGATKSPEDANRCFLAAAEQGHAIAEYCLAVISEDEGNGVEYVQYLESSASKGCDEACYSLSLSYYDGNHGLQKSEREAIRLLTPAAEKGHTKSMGLLGAMLCCGVDEDELMPHDNPDFTKGMHLLRRAIAKGHQKSVSNLKMMEDEASSKCFRCRKKTSQEKASFLRCSRCRAAWYCSKDCQVQHWKAVEGGHKQCCIKWCPQK